MDSAYNLTAKLTFQADMGGLRASINSAESQLRRLDTTARSVGATLREATSTISGAQNAGASFSQMGLGMRQVGMSAEQLGRNLGTVAANARNASNSLNAISGAGFARAAHETQMLADKITGATSAAKSGAAAMAAMGVSTAAAFAGVGLSARAGVRHMVEWNREQTALRQISEEAAPQIAKMGATVDKLARQYGVGAIELAKAGNTFKSANLSTADSMTALAAVAKARLNPSLTDSNLATEALISSFGVFGERAGASEKILGRLAGLSNAYATEFDTLSEAISRTGGAWKAAGGDGLGLASVMTVLRSRTREAAPELATALKSMAVRLSRPGAASELSSMGIDITDGRGRTLPFEQSLGRISEGVSGLQAGDPRKARVLEIAGGAYHFSRAATLTENWGEVEKARNVALASETSLTTTALQGLDSYERKLGRIKEAWLGVARVTSESKGFAGLVDGLERGGIAAAKLAETALPLIPLAAAFGASRYAGRFVPGREQFSGPAPTPTAYDVMGMPIGVHNPNPPTPGPGRFRQMAGRYALPGAAVAGMFAPSLLSGQGQTAESIGGLAQGAALGGTMGFALGGPIPAAIGAAVGGLTGLASAARDAAEAVRSNRIDSNLTTLNDRALSLSRGGTLSDSADANRLIGATRADLIERATLNATPSILGLRMGNPNAERLSSELRDQERRAFGPNQAGYVAALNEQAEALGRRSPGADPARLMADFAARNKGIVGIVSGISGRSEADTLAGFEKVLRTSQTSARTNNTYDKASDDITRVVTSFGRLSEQADRAGKGLEYLDARADALSGDIRPLPIDPTGPRALAPFGAGGAQLGRTLGAANDLERVLPGILSRAASGSPLDSESLSEQVRQGLREAFGNTGPELERGIGLVVADLSRQSLPELMRSIGSDVSGLARSTVAPFASPARNTAASLAGTFGANNARSAELIASAMGAGSQAGQYDDAAALSRLSRSRIAFELAGRTPADHLTLAQLSQPFTATQQRLAGRLSLNPEGMGTRLSQIRSEMGDAVKARDAAAPGKAFSDAAQRLAGLNSEAANLRAALAGLSDATRATSGAMERLSALQSNKDARLSYAERYIMADPKEKAEMRRQRALAIQAGKVGLDALPPNLRRQALAGFNAMGAMKLPELGERADEAKRRVLLPFAGVAKKDLDDEAAAKADILKAADRSIKANEILANEQRNLQQKYFATLNERDGRFLEGLRSAIISGQVADGESRMGAAGRTLSTLRTDKGAYDALRAGGVLNDETLRLAQSRRGDLEALAGSIEQTDKLGRVRNSTLSRMRGLSLGLDEGDTHYGVFGSNRGSPDGGTVSSGTLRKARDYLSTLSDLSPAQQDAALKTFSSEGYKSARIAWDSSKGDRHAAARKALEDNLRLSVGTTLGSEEGGLRSEQARIRQRLGQFGGIPEDALRGGALFQGLDRFDPRSNPLGGFPDKLGKAERDYGSAQDALQRLRPVELLPAPRMVPDIPRRPVPELAPIPRETRAGGGGAPDLSAQLAELRQLSETIRAAASEYRRGAEALAKSNESIPESIDLKTTGRMDVNVSGADALRDLDGFQERLLARIDDNIHDAISYRDPDARMRPPGRGWNT